MSPWVVLFPAWFLGLFGLMFFQLRRTGRLLPSGVRNSPKGPVLGIVGIVAAIGATIGATIVALGAWTGYYGAQSRAWPSVPGTVVSSEVAWHSGGGKRGGASYYDNRIEYGYAVAGTAYRGDRVRFGGDRPGYDGAMRFAARFAAGKTVPVYYDPACPARATLLRGALPMWPMEVAIGAVFLTAACFFLFLSLKWRLLSSDTPSA